MYNFRYNVEVIIIFDEVNNSYNIWMRLTPQYTQFILQQLNVYFLLFNLFFGHYFYCKFLSCCLMSAQPYQTKCSLAKHFPKFVSLVNHFHEFEFLVVVYVKSLFLGVRKRLLTSMHILEVFANLTHVVHGLKGMPQRFIIQCCLTCPCRYVQWVFFHFLFCRRTLL